MDDPVLREFQEVLRSGRKWPTVKPKAQSSNPGSARGELTENRRLRKPSDYKENMMIFSDDLKPRLRLKFTVEATDNRNELSLCNIVASDK